jgi:hypothetical protein
MPVVFRQNGLRFFFFSNEGSPPEPAHTLDFKRPIDSLGCAALT